MSFSLKKLVVSIGIIMCISTIQARLVPFADPFILYENGVYYAYGTCADDGIRCAVSKDLKTWKYEGKAKNNLALHKDDAYGEKWFWAPEIYKRKGKYYMFYSADEHLCVAVADNPLGPFTQEEKQPFFRNEKTIDGSLFIDKDGTPYLFYVRMNDGNNIWSVELSDDWLSVKEETMRYCIRADKPWELDRPRERVTEGPFVLYHRGKYIMTYSANAYYNQKYCIGQAVSKSVAGLWKKIDENPILQSRNGLVGLGHHSFFKDAKGKLKIVFHAHQNDKSVHPRIMVIADVTIKKGIVTISDEFLMPQLEE